MAGGKMPLSRGAKWTTSGMMSIGWSHRTAETIFEAAYSGSSSGSSFGQRVCTPSNMPVLMKKGQTQVVLTPRLPSLRISSRIDSSK